jgi:hypothetical protein
MQVELLRRQLSDLSSGGAFAVVGLLDRLSKSPNERITANMPGSATVIEAAKAGEKLS